MSNHYPFKKKTYILVNIKLIIQFFIRFPPVWSALKIYLLFTFNLYQLYNSFIAALKKPKNQADITNK